MISSGTKNKIKGTGGGSVKPSGGGSQGFSGGGSTGGGYRQYGGGNAALDSALQGYKDQYSAARDKGDWQGMRQASDSANQIRNQYGYAAQDASKDIHYIAGLNGGTGGGGGGGGGSYYPAGGQTQQQGQGDLYAQLLEEQRRKEAEIQARQEAAKKAAVEQAVGQLQGQKSGLEQSYADLYRQLYLDRRKAEKNLPQQMAAMGYNGGMTESTALGLQTGYADALRQGEQAKLGTMSDIDRAIQDARLNGDISIAEQAAQLAQQGFNSYADIIRAMQGQQNWNREFGYQAGRDQVSDSQWQQSFDQNKALNEQNLSRTQLLDQLSRDDVDYSRKLAAAQYLYENLGDASGLSMLGYTPEQIAQLGQRWAQEQAAAQAKGGSGSGGGGGGGKPALTYANMWDAINRGTVTQAVRDAWEYYMKEPWPEEGQDSGTGAGMSAGYPGVWQRVKTMFDKGQSRAAISQVIAAALEDGRITRDEAEKMLGSLGL